MVGSKGKNEISSAWCSVVLAGFEVLVRGRGGVGEVISRAA